jgi:hypothetical protein
MTTADRVDNFCSRGGDRHRSGPPLLHLRGTEYGLRILGLRIDEGDRGDDLRGSDHG